MQKPSPRQQRKGYNFKALQALALSIPYTRTSLLRPVCPAINSTWFLGTLKILAKNTLQASLASPSTGGAVSLNLRASPKRPASWFLAARG